MARPSDPPQSLLAPVAAIEVDPNQPRRDFDQELESAEGRQALEALAQSIRDQGVLQPILARRIGRGKYMIIAGERRWRAAQMAGLSRVPIIVRDDLSGMDLEMAQLSENLQRKDLSDIDVAKSIGQMMQRYPELQKKDLAKLLNRSPSYISRMMSMFDPRWSELTQSGLITWASVLESFKSKSETVQAEAVKRARESGKPITHHLLKSIESGLVRRDAAVPVPKALLRRLEAEFEAEDAPKKTGDSRSGRIADDGADFEFKPGAVPAASALRAPADPFNAAVKDLNLTQRATLGWDAFYALNSLISIQQKPLAVEVAMTAEEIKEALRLLGATVPRDEMDRMPALLRALQAAVKS